MKNKNGGRVNYGTPQTGKNAASRSASGRRCEVSGCPTVLSTYNDATTCWLHSPGNPRHALARS